MSQTWFHVERGAGRPLVLLHGIGMSHTVWAPVMDRLAQTRRVIAFDIAGFGRTPPLPAGVEPCHENLAAAMRLSLEALGIEGPVDLVGNSMGGHLALVAAREGLARSVVALSPAGLWSGRDAPAPVPQMLGLIRWLARSAPGLAERALRNPVARTLAFAVPMTSRGWRIGAEEAVETLRTFAAARAFNETLTAATRLEGGQDIAVPLTVVFGSRDWLLTKACQNRDSLPPHTRWLRPRGWGHVPVWDDPEGVARVILDGTA